MKWFPEFIGNRRTNGFRIGRGAAALCSVALCAVVLTASGALIAGLRPGLLLGAGNGLTRWLENAEAGSGVENALYRLMQLPGGEVLYRRAPDEARTELTALIANGDGGGENRAALYSLRAIEDEQALDFDAAERDWKLWAAKADDRAAAQLDLADFYKRRLEPQKELEALEAVGASAASPRERWTPADLQRPWKAWERALGVVNRDALGREAAQRVYAGWEQRYPRANSICERELSFDLAGKDFSSASEVIARYRKAFPADAQFPVSAEARIEAGRGSAKDGLAVFDRSFEPLWPAALVKSYYDLLESTHQTLQTRDALRAALAAHPEGGADALKDAAKLFYIFQQQGQLEAAKAVLAGYRERKDARGAAWSVDELYTLGRLMEAVQDFPEAARYYYALASEKQTPDGEEKGLAGLARILLTAPEQPLRVGEGNLALYKSIATMDRGPGYLNGILSLFFNSQQPASQYATEDELAAPYFHRARAAEIVAEIDRRFPQAADRAELHAKLMDAYAAYGENDAEIREGKLFLAQFPNDPRRVQVALETGDAYSRIDQPEKEFALYKSLLQELAARADGVPLGAQDEGSAAAENGVAASGARSAEYAQVLDRYLSRLVALQRLPDALELLRGELDRNPQDPGLYEKLAQFLEQNRLDAHEEEVYQRAVGQFQQSGLATGWYGKLARFYLREKRAEDYAALTRKVAGIFSGTELEAYLRQAPAPDSSLALEVDLYAHDRFPHDLTFVRDLLALYENSDHSQPEEAEKLLWAHWAEAPDLRDQLFELLSRTGRLDATLATLRQQDAEIGKGDWTALAASNPAAERFWMESCLWQSHYEQGVGAADALAAEYPADATLGETASSLYRSLAYFHPEDTDKAVAIEKRLLSVQPDDLDRLARIGDIYADRGRMSEAAPYWTRMGEVHPGEADGYLQAATVFWDYFDFASAGWELSDARAQLKEPALFGYQAGAIAESRGDMAGAIHEYVASSLGDKPSEESRARLLELARRPELRAEVDAETAGLMKPAAPTATAIELRVSVLAAERQSAGMKQELEQLTARTDSFDVLDAVSVAAREQSLPVVEQEALRRQIALTSDPVHGLELRYQLVDLLGRSDPAAAAVEVDAIYRDHAKVLGVVRATVDYDWQHGRKQLAVNVLEDAAGAAYPELKQKFQLEAARKLTDLGEYPRSKQMLEALLGEKPLDAGVESALADNYVRSGDQAGLAAFYRTELAAVKASSLERGEKTERIGELRRGMIAALERLGNWDDAADQYIELINAYPDDAGLAQEAALMVAAHGESKKLTDFYSKTVEASPRDARWSIVLARTETALEDYPAAIAAYAKAIRVRPEQKDLYVAKADLEERLYRLDDAVADYDQLYKLSYHDPQWRVKAAEARAREGRTADAVAALEDAWINGKPASAANEFAVATQLEQWGLLNEARGFAEQGIKIAGTDLLVNDGDQSGAAVYARIMARLRQSDAAFTVLAIARQQAEQVSLAAVAEQVARQGFSAVTDEEWRRQRAAERAQAARSGFARALESMAAAVGEFYTPEEKAQFAAWLQGKSAQASDGAELRIVYLPAMRAAGLEQMQADLLWEFAEKSGRPGGSELSDWVQLERSRVQLEGAGAKIEQLAAEHPREQRQILRQAADVYREQGDAAGELRVMDRLMAMEAPDSELWPRYDALLLRARPQDLVGLASGNGAAQFLVEHGSPALALAGIDARSSGLPPVWKKAYTGLTGLYMRQHTPEVRAGFDGALGGGATIGERVAHPVDRTEQLAGEVWFYYGSRYGEYLDEEKDPQAESYLQSELEHTPESANAYTALADYSAEAGRPDAALIDYQHSLDLKSDQPAVLDKIALIEWKQGRQSDALAAWQLAVKRLAAEMDARRVPESFWNDFSQVLGDAAAEGQYAAIGDPVDAMLRVYLARNGNYRAEPLLEAGYRAHGDSMDWLLGITAAASDPGGLLSSMQQSDWIAKGQRSQLLARMVELDRSKAQTPGESNWSLEQDESSLITALLDEKKFDAARAELERIPAGKRFTAQWLGAELRLGEAENELPQMVAQWKKQPETAPSASDVQNAVSALSAPSKRIVLRFVYERALGGGDLTATNFLGLAGIDLDEGEAADAVALLKRLTLVSADPYTDTDAAAGLLEARGRYAEAIQFLQPLAQAFPWKASYKVRLAAATLAGNAQSQQALAMLDAVAADPKATYAERVTAAKALQGRGAANASLGSEELQLLAGGGCPGTNEVDKPFFIEARRTAADCVSGAQARALILRPAIAADPDNTALRLQYAQAEFAAGEDARGLIAAGPIFQSGQEYGQYDSGEYGLTGYEAASQSASPLAQMKPEDAARLFWFAIHAREKRQENEDALSLLRDAASIVMNAPLRQGFEAESRRLEAEAAREEENQARAPEIHAELNQANVVRPRVLPGAAFVPGKKADGEGDAE